MSACAICGKTVNTENAPILTMGAYGTPLYICEECAEELDTATAGTDYYEIKQAFGKIVKKIEKGQTNGEFVNDTLQNILDSAVERAEKIKNGTYNFGDDAQSKEDELEDIPEELAESEEDARLDEKDAERNARFEKIFNIGMAIAIAAAAVFALVRFVF